jgi:glutaminase
MKMGLARRNTIYKTMTGSTTDSGSISPTIRAARRSLIKNGFLQDDPRWEECFEKLELEDNLTEDKFIETFKPRLAELHKALENDLIICDFEAFTNVLGDIFDKIRETVKGGDTAKYIPQLSKKKTELFGFSVCSIDGQRFSRGDYEESFCIQACANPITYAIALETFGEDTVHKYVDKEPSGTSFNALSFTDKDLPYNPLVNSGAIVLCSLIGQDNEPSVNFENVLKWWRRAAGGFKPGFDNCVYLSERLTADKNKALARLMKSKKILKEDTKVDDLLDFYFQLCSIEMDCNLLSIVAATLANGGICPLTHERVFGTKTIRAVLSLMYSCGMYEQSGQFAFNVGLPAKSGVSGAMIVVVPGVCGFAIYSPLIDPYGNSVKGTAFCNELVKRFKFHNFDLSQQGTLDPRKKRSATHVKFFYASFENDIMSVRMMIRSGINVNMKDYDGRTALHIACSEGNYEIVKLLLENKADPDIKDRWNKTPFDNAVEGGFFEIENLIRKHKHFYV